tara:strand:+ start:755 stop:3259 length:2505 start_codon:yes stop_codon:yes gene_type:complete
MQPEVADSIARQANAKVLRRELHPAIVLSYFNHKPQVVGRMRLSYSSPFREDTNPSLDIFRSRVHEWRVGDFAEGWQGSVLDLILRFKTSWSVDQAIELARQLYATQLQSGVDYDSMEKSSTFHWPNPKHNHAAAERWHYYYSVNHPCLPPVGFLRANFDIHVMENEMVWAPYYDQDSEIVGYKTLSKSGGKRAGAGSKMTLYGSREHLRLLREDTEPVIICEGESDTWVMTYLYGDNYTVVGFPGANQNIQELLGTYDPSVWLERDISIVFDGDAAGTSGRTQVAEWLTARGADVSITPLPDNKDVADMQEKDIRDLFDKWQMPFGESQKIVRVGNLYRRLTSDNQSGAEITNWAIDIERFLIGESSDTWAVEGRIAPTGRKVTITGSHFRSVQKLIDWSQSNARQFFGNTTDAQKLGSYLLNEATMKPVGRMTTRVGLHRGDFVWGNGSIGDQEWRYIARETGIKIDSSLTVLPEDVTKEKASQVLDKLINLHQHEVTMPILCWLAVAPLRPLIHEFPILHLSGTSGSGKTALTHTFTYMFSGSRINSNLTTTTPFAISSHFMASNAFPVWFDEYRPGARDDAKKTLDQLLRDTYTGQVSTKGSMNQNRAEVTQILTDTPIIVTGEDTLSEKSHVDRSIMINIPMEGKNRENMEFFDFESPIAYLYLSWLHKNYLTNEVNLPKVVDLPDHLTGRQQNNFRVLQYGYNLLQDFAAFLDENLVIPDKSWNLIIHDAKTASSENPILELIRWAYESEDRAVFAIEEEGKLGVSTIELMRIQNAPWGPRLPLPFEKHTAFGRWLEDHLAAKKERVFHQGKQKRVYVIDYDKVINDA